MRRTGAVGLTVGALLTMGLGIAVAESLVCDGGTCFGTDRPDRMIGSSNRDVIFALGNRDQVSARSGSDDLHGDGGPDDLCGEEGNDHYGGGRRGDVLSEFGDCGRDFRPAGNGASGDDHMLGGGGNDFIEGSDGADTIVGGDGADIQGTGSQGGQGFAQLYGDPGNDVIRGKEKADGMEGEEGDDRLFGGKGNDIVDAADDESPGGEDFVDCGEDYDRAVANRNDVVAQNCERVLRKDNPTVVGVASRSDAEQARALAAALSR